MAGANPMAGASPMAGARPMAQPGAMGYQQNMGMYGAYGAAAVPGMPQPSPYGAPYGQQQYGMAAVPGAYGAPTAAPTTGYGMPTPYSGAVPMNGSGGGMAPMGSHPMASAGKTMSNPGSGSGMASMGAMSNYPTIEKIHFHIPANLKEKYGNLYSIIATVDALMTEEIEGNVTQEDVDALLPNYKNMYEMIKKALRIDDDQVKAFCDSVNLTAGYAFHAFEECGKSPEAPEEERALSAGELMQLGTRFTTLSDYVSCGAIKTSEINALYKEIISTIGRTNFLKENDEGESLARQCKDLLNAQPQDQPPNEDVRRDFMYKISTLHGLFMGSL
jgi:hypothetical protein